MRRRKQVLGLLATGAIAATLHACESTDDNDGVTDAGAGAPAGTSTGGRDSGGQSTVTSGGAAGSGGAATSSGSAGRGDGGARHCQGGLAYAGSPPDYCSFAETCAVVECGEPWSLFDEDLCRRAICTSSADCEPGERCAFDGFVRWPDCAPSIFEGCSLNGGVCECTQSEDCNELIQCVPVDVADPADDCLWPMDCEDAEYALQRLKEGQDSYEPWGDDMLDAFALCRDRLEQLIQRLDGCGEGAGAGGGSGGEGGAAE